MSFFEQPRKEDLKKGDWVELYDGNHVKITGFPELARTDIFVITHLKPDGGAMVISSPNITRKLTPEEYPELYL